METKSEQQKDEVTIHVHSSALGDATLHGHGNHVRTAEEISASAFHETVPRLQPQSSSIQIDLDELLEESLKETEEWVPACSECACCHGFCSSCVCTKDHTRATSICVQCANKFEADKKVSRVEGEFSSAFSLAFGGSPLGAVPQRALDAAAAALHTQTPPSSSVVPPLPSSNLLRESSTSISTDSDEYNYSVKVFTEARIYLVFVRVS